MGNLREGTSRSVNKWTKIAEGMEGTSAVTGRDHHKDCRHVRICDPTTQLRSWAEPEDPIYSSSLSLLCFWMVSASHLDLSPLYYTSLYFTFFTSIHLLISHPLPLPPIFLSVPRFPLDSLRTRVSSHLLCSAVIVFKISFLYFCILRIYIAFSCLSLAWSNPPTLVSLVRPPAVCSGLWLSGHLWPLVSLAFQSSSTCGCVIVNSYQPDAFLTPQPSIPGHVQIPLESKHNKTKGWVLV